MEKAIAYLRVSTDDQALGPVAQSEAISRWCADNGYELAATFEDSGISGGATPDKRPGMMAAISALAESGATALVIAKRDRLSRDKFAGAMAERMVKKVGARVMAVDANNDDTPEGLLSRGMLDLFAEYERALIRARTKAALAVKKSRGELVGAVPYGYQLAADGVHLETNDAEQRIIEIVDAYATEGVSLREVCRRLHHRGILPRSGNQWYPMTIKRIINREAA